MGDTIVRHVSKGKFWEDNYMKGYRLRLGAGHDEDKAEVTAPPRLSLCPGYSDRHGHQPGLPCALPTT